MKTAVNFGFIGCGNMGGALARAVSKVDRSIALSSKSGSTSKKLALEIKAQAASNAEIAKFAKFIVLGVKPQVLFGVISEIAPILKERKDKFVVISMVAGVKIEKITAALGEKVAVIRIMPNTPSAVGGGITEYSVNKYVSKKDKAEFLKAFSASGEMIEIAEGLIDAASAVSGCGPAFVYMFIQSMADAGVECGLPRATALKLAAGTVKGAGAMVLETGEHPEALKDAVCSPGGSTIVGVEELENGAFRGTVANAVVSAYEKTKKLGE